MKNTEIVVIKGDRYLIDFDRMEVYKFDKENSHQRYKAMIKNPNLAQKMKKLNKRDMELLLENSKYYDPKKHKFKDEQVISNVNPRGGNGSS